MSWPQWAVGTGTVTDTDGNPVPGAVLDVWQADAEGNYESQIAGIDEARLRAKYRARPDGTYCVRTIAPLGYSIPMDGPVGRLIGATDISHYRPAHVHFMLAEDALIVPFEPREAGPTPDGTSLDRPYLHANYDFVLERA
jgi:hydroxyquinol 1,2-dioxygenase